MTGVLHVVLARKPVEGTVAENCLKFGCGALNIDACRVVTAEKLTRALGKTTESASGWKSVKRSPVAGKDGGRWPANLMLGHLEVCRQGCEAGCAVATLGEQSGVKTSGKSKRVHEEYGDAFKFGGGLSTPENQYGDTGTASRFFFNYREQESDE